MFKSDLVKVQCFADVVEACRKIAGVGPMVAANVRVGITPYFKDENAGTFWMLLNHLEGCNKVDLQFFSEQKVFSILKFSASATETTAYVKEDENGD